MDRSVGGCDRHSWGIIVLDQQDRMLLLQHRQEHWSFCKDGKERHDISDIHTAARELSEETGLRVLKLWMEHESWQENCNTIAQLVVNPYDLEFDEYVSQITPVEPLRPRIFTEEYPFRRITKRVDFYVARIRGDSLMRLHTTEIRAFRWLPLNQVAEGLTFEEDRDLFNSILSMLR